MMYNQADAFHIKMAHRAAVFIYDNVLNVYTCTYCGLVLTRASTSRHLRLCRRYLLAFAKQKQAKTRRRQAAAIKQLLFDGKMSVVGRRLCRVTTHHTVDELADGELEGLQKVVKQLCNQKLPGINTDYIQREIIQYSAVFYLVDK